MKKYLLLFILASPAFAFDTVNVINSTNNPVNVTGTIITSSFTFVNNLSTHVSVDNFPTTQAVTGTFFQSVQPVSFSSANVTGSTVNIQGTVPVSQSGVWTVTPDRPSQKTGRVYKQFIADQISSNTTSYTVTAGKTLYITSLNISAYNANTAVAGHVQIRDNTTVLIPISIPQAGVAALASFVPLGIASITFSEPKQFSTNFNIFMAAGTNTVSLDATGYEE